MNNKMQMLRLGISLATAALGIIAGILGEKQLNETIDKKIEEHLNTESEPDETEEE